MGNGVLPNGPSYRAHPRLYLLGPREMSDLSPRSGPKRTLGHVAVEHDGADTHRVHHEKLSAGQGVMPRASGSGEALRLKTVVFRSATPGVINYDASVWCSLRAARISSISLEACSMRTITNCS